MKRGSLRCPIPEDMRDLLEVDSFMRRCIIDDDMCDGRLEWNHAFTYAGKRVNELWAIIPMCHTHHEQQAKWRPLIEQRMRQRIKQFGVEKLFRKEYPKSTLLKVYA